MTGVTQTGMYLNEQPQFDLQLMVTVPGKPPYPARHKSFVPLMLIGRVTSGQPLAVRVDPMDPQKHRRRLAELRLRQRSDGHAHGRRRCR